MRKSFGMAAQLFVCKQVNDISMETKQKVLYEAPSMMVFEVRHEGIICASEVKGGNSINNWGTGSTTDDDIYM